jgi:hypothetical protein
MYYGREIQDMRYSDAAKASKTSGFAGLCGFAGIVGFAGIGGLVIDIFAGPQLT